MIYYLIHDFDEDLKKLGTVSSTDINFVKRMNELGFGVFTTVNKTFNAIRTIEKLTCIDHLFVDIDGIEDKLKVLSRIESMAPTPSRIVESRNGYHVYYKMDKDLREVVREAHLSEDIILEEFEISQMTHEMVSSLLADRLIPFFKADPRVKDATRLLRVPGFYHMKKNQPFLVKEIFRSNAVYSLEEIERSFPKKVDEAQRKKNLIELLGEDQRSYVVQNTNNIFSKVNLINGKDFLTKLSGHDIVNGEKYSFQPNSSGHQISVDGKTTAQWVDRQGYLGGGSGKNVYWLKWYLDKKALTEKEKWQIIARTLQELFGG